MSYDDAESMLRGFEARIDDQLNQADQLRNAMETVQAEHETRDGSIAVKVDSSGGLADLRLSDAALRLAPNALASEILACTRAAQAKLAGQMAEAMNRVMGSGSETAAFVSQTYAERFPVPKEDTEPQRYRDSYYDNKQWRRR